MAIARAAARLLVQEAARLRFRGRLLQLGPQRLYLDAGQLRSYASSAGLPLPREVLDLHSSAMIPAELFYRSLGFEAVESCDLLDPSATHRFDLNEAPPAHLHGRFDTVLDGGTMEHVFDTRRVLATIHDVLNGQGRSIHLAPTNNYVDHGFYMFSPQLFTGWYAANGWSTEAAWLLEHNRRWRRGRWRASAYRPGALDHRTMGGWERGSLLFLSIARKGSESTSDRVPQQGDDRQAAAPAGQLRRKVRSAAALLDESLPSDVIRIRPRRLPTPRQRL